MIQIRPILLTLGSLLCVLAVLMLVPTLVAFGDAPGEWIVFVASAAFTLFVGGLFIFAGYGHGSVRVGVREGFLLTTLSWVVVTAFAAVPFTGLGLPYTDAFFEAMSGLTTTGASVMTGLNKLPHGILLWRALLQGIGGLGIVVMAIMILPYLRIGGLQLFQTESSDRSEKVLPRAVEIMKAIAKIYFLMLFACAMLYMMFGMTLFDAVCYSLATVATGGFAVHDQSFGFFESPSLELIAIVFMILGVMPFVALVKAIHGDFRAPWHDPQVRGFITFLAVVIITVGVWYSLTNDVHLLTALRLSAFNVTSVVTTTGFASGDYSAWGPFAVGVFFLLMFVGGCTGSTAGGIKIYRMQMAALVTRGYLRNLISPNRVATLVYSGRRVPEDVPLAVIAFLGMYMATVGAVTLILTAMGLDFLTSISSAASAIGNVGPGLGEIVGPVGNYSSLPAGAKWVLAAAMLLGRLELFTVLVLFRPEFWR